MAFHPKKQSKAVTKPPGRKTAEDHSLAPPHFNGSEFLPFLVAAFVLWRVLLRFRRSSRKEISRAGYVLVDGQLEHRMIAERVLGRKLVSGEVVHHINGIKTDNRQSNLCVLSKFAHDDFHTWLRWKVEKEGFYPPRRYQRAVLRDRYHGILLVTYPSDLPPLEAESQPKRRGNDPFSND